MGDYLSNPGFDPSQTNTQELSETKENHFEEIESIIRAQQEKTKDSPHMITQETDSTAQLWNDLFRGPESTPRGQQNKELLNIFKSKLDGKTLVDLGVGPSENILPPNVAEQIGLKKYIALDEELQALDQGENDMAPEIEDLKNTGVEVVTEQEDMLRFVANSEDESMNFLIGLIDEHIIQDERYWQALGEEISRTTEKQGIVITLHSPIGAYLKNFKNVEIGNLYDDYLKIYEKVDEATST